MRARRIWALVLAMASVAVVTGCTSDDPVPPAPTVQVERSSVNTRVTASGALVPVTSQSLAFPMSEKIEEVRVKVGDEVTPGQLLARLDDFSFRQTLAEQQGVLRQQEALLEKVKRSADRENAQDSLVQAQRRLDAAEDFAASSSDQAANAVFRAETQLGFDEKAADKAIEDFTRANCDLEGFTLGGPDGSGARTPPPDSGEGSGGSGGLGMLDNADSTANARASRCDSLQQAAIAAKRQVVESTTQLSQARANLKVVEDEGRVRVEDARQGVVDANNNRRTADTDRPSDIEAQAGLVAQARAQVAAAQREIENTVLYAPVAGTVSAINGSVGEFVNAGGGTTAKAPGSTAPIPGVGAAATADQTNSNVGAPTATRPGGDAFLVLNNLDTFEVVVPFEESDAARVAPNQKVEVRFDAIPDLTLPGTVLQIAPGGTSISGVTNYYVTVLLTQSDPRLEAGQTTEVGVLVDSLDGVLVVPNAAVIPENGRTFVLVPGGPDGQPQRVQFQAGAVGDRETEVVSGLQEGQEIILPPAGPAPAPPPPDN
ncbi:MAG: efflux RND transporter periplasmic adaptor subunit [Pseudonocardia sp.]